jgi:hypothetical protein
MDIESAVQAQSPGLEKKKKKSPNAEFRTGQQAEN